MQRLICLSQIVFPYISCNYSSFIVSDINECLSSPCNNNGVCFDEVNAYTCECQAGYDGPTCQTGEVSQSV